MTPDQVRQIVKDEINKNYNSGDPSVPAHEHNGNDALTLNPITSVQGFTPIPVSNTKYLNTVDGTYEYGFASPLELSVGNSSHASQSLLNSNIAQYPIPVIYGNGAGIQGSFNGGYAPDGTLVFFYNISAPTTQSGLYIRVDGAWLGVGFNLTA